MKQPPKDYTKSLQLSIYIVNVFSATLNITIDDITTTPANIRIDISSQFAPKYDGTCSDKDKVSLQ